MTWGAILPFRSGAILTAVLLVTACGGGGSDSATESKGNPLVVDSSFADQGSVRIALAPYNGTVSSIVEQADGKLVVAGHRKLGPVNVSEYTYGVRPATTVFVNRYLENGQLDASFGSNGATEFSVRGADQLPVVNLAADGNMYVSVNASKPCHLQYAGSVRFICVNDNVEETTKWAWVRIGDNGVVDTGDLGEGLSVSQLPERIQQQQRSGLGQRIDLQDGKYLEFQTFAYPLGNMYGWTLKRYLANGEVDTQFGTDGSLTSRCSAKYGRLLVDKDSNIWVLGSKNGGAQPYAFSGLCIEKFSAEGQPSANAPSPITTELGVEPTVHDARFLTDGTLLVAASSYRDSAYDMKMLKYYADGRLVSDFGSQGIADLKGLTGDAGSGISLRIKDGTGAIAGSRPGMRYSYNNVNQPNLWVQWKSDGSLDRNYGQDGIWSLGDMPDYSQRGLAFIDSKKRWLLKTESSEGPSMDAAGWVTLTRYVGESK